MARTTSDQIESHIRSKREDLRSNLEELEGRVRSVVDWREQFRRYPAAGLGLAVGVGFLLATATTRSRRRAAGGHVGRAMIVRRGHVRGFLETVQSTLIGIAAARGADLLTELVLGRKRDALRGEADGASDDVQGEGDYRAARRHRHSAEAYAHSADISRAARQAAPGNPAEAAEMARAEAAGRARARSPRT
jgi:hypothetical protein